MTRLREEGHTVLAIVEMEPSISDEAVLEIANQQGMVLLTGDKDFGELVFRDRQYAFGIVLIRLSGLTAMAKAEIVVSAKINGRKETMAGNRYLPLRSNYL